MNIADSPHHLDYEALAELAEGLLDGEQAASAGEHLAGCPECREREAELSEVSRILAEAPVPPMPAELAARIDAALAAERTAPAISGELHAARLRRFRVLSAAAAAVVVLGGGATVAKIMSQSSVTADKGQSLEVTSPSHPVPNNSPQIAQGRRPDAEGAHYPVVSTGTDYRTATLTAQVNAALKQTSGPARVSDTAGQAACVAAASPGRTPLLVDVGARYKGARATVIVLSSATPGSLDVVIAGPGCTTGHPNVLTQARATAN